MSHATDQPDNSAFSQRELGRTIRDSRWLTLAKVLAAAMMFFQVVFLARTLGEREYGHWAMIVSVGFLLHRCCTPRTNEWLIRFLPQFRAAGDFQRSGRLLTFTVVVECLTAGVAFGLLWILAPLIAQWLLHASASVESVRIYGWVMIALVFEDSASALLRLNERYRVLALQRIISVVVRGVALVLLWQIGPTLDRALWAMVGWFLMDKLMLVPLAIWAYRSMGYSLAPLREVLPDRSLIRSVLPFTALTSAYAILDELRGRLDLLVLGILVSPEQLAGYDVARRTVRQGELLVQPLQESLQPRLAMLYAGGGVFGAEIADPKLDALGAAGHSPVVCRQRFAQLFRGTGAVRRGLSRSDFVGADVGVAVCGCGLVVGQPVVDAQWACRSSRRVVGLRSRLVGRIVGCGCTSVWRLRCCRGCGVGGMGVGGESCEWREASGEKRVASSD